MGLDEDLFHALNGAGDPFLDPVMIAFGFAGLLFVAILWSFPLWFGGRRREAADLPILLLLDGVLTALLKSAIRRPRPTDVGTVLDVPLDDVLDFSFPSGHTTRAFAAALLLTVRTRDWRWGVPLFAYASVMAVSRVYIGVHWPSDVVAGALLGMTWAYVFVRMTRLPRYMAWRDAIVGRLTRTRVDLSS